MQLKNRTFLVTGGAGFIGRRLIDELTSSGASVRVLDALLEQVHGPAAEIVRKELSGKCDFVHGDVRDRSAVRRAAEDVDGVFHLAAEVGVGQSMYEIERYTATNDLGTAVLMQALIENPVERIVVASSMSIYGEGLYEFPDGSPCSNAVRKTAPPWDPTDRYDRPLRPVATPESKPPDLTSVYALNKLTQERLVHIAGAAYGMETVALRLFNVYGPGQALSNPYTGVLAIFASRLLHDQPPRIFEDGEQRRDFVHVDDVARAFCRAMETPAAAGETLNIGSGRSVSIREVAEALAAAMDRPALAPEILHAARSGDIRHCFADVSRALDVLGFEARRDFFASLPELADWVSRQEARDMTGRATEELRLRGLVA